MALVNPDWGYWRGPFVAMALSPVHADGQFPFLLYHPTTHFPFHLKRTGDRPP
ncbi:hypothetical protein BJX68DRAFT_242070 [Aspergillus pseudodeflectus]|uniref:Uncharacterized protein n=1 Tax=Aspergillus pseudodeflectus TaxID=176178 RepID=A0ABR4JZX3_9EURO